MAINPKPFRGGLDFANQAALLDAMLTEKRKDYLSNQGTSKPASFKGGLDFANQAAFEDVIRAAEEEQLRQYMEKSRLADIAREEDKMAEYQSLYPANDRLFGITPRPATEVGRGGFQPPTIDLDRAARQRTGDMEFLQPGPYQRTFNTPTSNLQTMMPNPKGGYTVNPPNKAEAALNSALDTGEQKARDQMRNYTPVPEGIYKGTTTPTTTPQNETEEPDRKSLLSQIGEGASSFFGGVGDVLSSPLFSRIFQIVGDPRFQDPRGPSRGFVEAAYGIQQDEAKALAAARELQLEYDKIAADLQKSKGGNKLTDPVLRVIDRTASASRGLNAIDAYRTLLSVGGPTGGIGQKFDAALDRIGGLFNIGEGTTAQKAEALRQVILIELNEALDRGHITKSEVDEAYKFLEQPGQWTKSSSEKLLNQLNLAHTKLKSIQTLGSNTLRASGYDPVLYNPYTSIQPLITGERKDN
jgi:hypothetical protein